MKTPEEHSRRRYSSHSVTAAPNTPPAPPLLCSFVLKIKENSLFCLFLCFDFKNVECKCSILHSGDKLLRIGVQVAFAQDVL